MVSVVMGLSSRGSVGDKWASRLLAPDQQAGVGGVDRHQFSLRIACRAETLGGASGDPVVCVTNHSRCVAEACCHRADDPAIAVANIVLVEQFVFAST